MSATTTTTTTTKKYQTYIFYCHAPGASEIGDENYHYFRTNALSTVDKNSTCVCILLNMKGVTKITPTWIEPDFLLEIRRPNIGWDFGAYADGLRFMNLDKEVVAEVEEDKKQDVNKNNNMRVFFINDTVFGPCLPWWIRAKTNWIQIFSELITEDVKLAGTTINACSARYPTQPHVQSMFLVTDAIGLQIAWKKGTIFIAHNKKQDVIGYSEVGFSSAILEAGYNIDCTATALRGYNYRVERPWLGDPSYEGAYHGFTVHPYEVIFMKTNRIGRDLSHLLMGYKQPRKKNIECAIS